MSGPGKIQTPIQGGLVSEVTVPAGSELVADAKKLAEQRAFTPELSALADTYVREVLSNLTIYDGRKIGGGTMLHVPLRQAPAVAEDEQLESSMRRRMAEAGLALEKVWANGLVEERELKVLEKALERLGSVRELEKALPFVDREVAKRLKPGFELLARLETAGRGQLAALYGALQARDGADLTARLANPAAIYADADLAAIARHGMTGIERYRVGDLVALDRGLGVVVGPAEGGKLRVETLDRNANVEVLELSQSKVGAKNPLKIGDRLDLGDGRVLFVKPSVHQGVEVVQLEGGAQLRDVPIPEAQALITARLQSQTRLGAPVITRTPQERIFVGNGDQIDAVQAVGNAKLGTIGAVYSMAKPGAAKSCDAVGFQILGPDGFAMAVGDGSGSSSWRASSAAVNAVMQAGEAVRDHQPAKDALPEAFESMKLDRNAGDSVVSGLIASRTSAGWQAEVVQVGDSIAWHFSARGILKNQTKEENRGRELADSGQLHRVGRDHLVTVTNWLGGGTSPRLDRQTWKLDPGDFVVVVSHGATRANFEAQLQAKGSAAPFSMHHTDVTRHQIASLLAGAAGPEDAAEKIRAYVVEQWAKGAGMAGDLTIAVAQVPR